MPTVAVSLSNPDPYDAVKSAIERIEAGNGEVLSVGPVGDQYLIVYKAKPRVGRPPKTETRG